MRSPSRAAARWGVGVVTSEFKINYLRPARGETLVARAEVVHCGRTQAVCRYDIFSSDGGAERLCATAQGTVAKLPTPSEDLTVSVQF